MGILNVTPDSFSDGGRYLDSGKAVARAEGLVAAGADIVDVGGESSRPGAAPVAAAEEERRILPVIKRLAASLKEPVSVDSYKPSVVEAAVDAGARMINDISGLGTKTMRRLVGRLDLPVIIMHMRGRPGNMQKDPRYRDVLKEVGEFLETRMKAALEDGVKREKIILDPGIGFGKRLEHNLSLLRGIRQLKKLGQPLAIGVSRKSMLGEITGREVDDRLAGSVAVACFAANQGADLLRVHDVAATRDALLVLQALGLNG